MALRSTAAKVLSALRARRDPNPAEASVLRATLRLLESSEEGQLNLLRPTRAEATVHSPTVDSKGPMCVASAAVVPGPERLRELVVMLQHSELPPFCEALAVVTAATEALGRLPNVVRVPVPKGGRLVVVGDLHGQLEDMERVLEAHGGPSACTHFLFNGDFVDRGNHGLEVLLTLFSLMLLLPGVVHLNRGNHECDHMNRVYGFREELAQKYNPGGEELYDAIQEAFASLPLVHVVGGSIAVLHGGLPPDPSVSLDEIQALDRRAPLRFARRQEELSRAERLHQALLWSDPKDFFDGKDWEPSDRGAGVHFGAGLVASFLEGNGLKRLVRSHEVCSPGYSEHHGGLTATVFSASNYAGTDDNHGCCLVVHPSLKLEFRQHSALPGAAGRPTGPAACCGGEHAAPASPASEAERRRRAKRECLGRLRCAVLAKRQELMHEFEQFDAGRQGTVSLGQWVEACRTCIGPGLPWFALSRYLVAPEADGRVPYLPFLERFQNCAARRWMQSWAVKMRPFLAECLVEHVQKHGRRMSYPDLCRIMRQELPGITESSIYYLLVTMCPGGQADMAMFLDGDMDVREPPCALDLWVMSAFQPNQWRVFRSAWPDSLPLPCSSVAAAGMRARGQVGHKARSRWESTAAALDPCSTGLVEWEAVEALADRLGADWQRASQVLELLCVAARARVGPQRLFSSLDVQASGALPPEAFIEAIEPWLGRRLRPPEMALLISSLDLDGDGLVTAAEFVAALEVVDTWDYDAQRA